MDAATSRESAYHAGERFVQEQAGEVASAIMGIGAIHATIPGPAFAFLRERAFIVIAATDADGAVWCSQLGWSPGFIRAIDEHTVGLDALPAPDDPLATILQNHCKVGTIAIDFATRRRMRLNGTSRPSETGMYITADQVYANCPKYITQRSIESHETLIPSERARRSATLDAEARAIVSAADTFFIGSAIGDGADASHRGGPAGFVEIVDDQMLRWPDYFGNAMFMTLGNVTASPPAGLLFIDWSTGTTLHLTGRARIDWTPAAARRFAGAKRVVEFEIGQSILTPGASPLRWSSGTLAARSFARSSIRSNAISTCVDRPRSCSGSANGRDPSEGTLPIPVSFSASGVQAIWTPGLTLLELAESCGLQPAFGCRSGTCGTCATRIEAGSIDYIQEPIGRCDDDEVLICCSVPRSDRLTLSL